MQFHAAIVIFNKWPLPFHQVILGKVTLLTELYHKICWNCTVTKILLNNTIKLNWRQETWIKIKMKSNLDKSVLINNLLFCAIFINSCFIRNEIHLLFYLRKNYSVSKLQRTKRYPHARLILRLILFCGSVNMRENEKWMLYTWLLWSNSCVFPIHQVTSAGGRDPKVTQCKS